MLGYAEEELLAASVSDIHPAEEVADDLQRFQAVAEGRVSINEDRPVLRKDGSIFYADITGHRIVYEGGAPAGPVPRCHRTQAGPGGVTAGTSHPQAPVSPATTNAN